jgi:hypothetical protein
MWIARSAADKVNLSHSGRDDSTVQRGLAGRGDASSGLEAKR